MKDFIKPNNVIRKTVRFNIRDDNKCDSNESKDSNVFVKNVNNNKVNKNMKEYSLKFFSSNVRGITSKIGSVRNVLSSENIDVCMLSETQLSGNNVAKIPGYTAYYRNRVGKAKGGICVYIKDRWAQYAMKLESGEGPNEYFFVKLEAFDPAIVICIYYGVIEGQYSRQSVTDMQSELFNTVKQYTDAGCTLVWGGDFNNHIGKELGLVKNTKDKSPGGKYLVNFLQEENLELLNVRHQEHTHIDESNESSKILDLVITNHGEKVTDFRVDHDYKITPYRVRKVKQNLVRKHSDHLAISWKVKTMSKVKESNRTTSWRYSKPGGNAKFEEETNRIGEEVENMLLSGADLNSVYEHILSSVEKAKLTAYGKSTKTKNQAKKDSDKVIWRKRMKEIQRAIDGLQKSKLTDRIWEMRSNTSTKFQDQQFVSVADPSSGKLTKSREETFDTMLKYNTELLDKEWDLLESDDEDEEVNDEVIKKEKAREKIKRDIIKQAMKMEEREEDKQLDEELYWKVLKKIKLKNKNVYRDLIMSGEKFKRAMFMFFNECYKQEFTPEDFCETILMKLYKNKGVRTQLKSNRFIHLKTWMPKTYEKMLMTKIEGRMSDHTPRCQIGGRKLSSTNEHLATSITLMRRLEKEQGGGGTIYMDVRSCFDKVHLRDIIFQTARAGVVGKPLRAISEYTNNLKIKLMGDIDPNREAKIKNSTGQGSGFAPVGTSMVTSVTLDEKIQEKPEKIQRLIRSEIKGVPLEEEFFVDDLSKVAKDEVELAENGIVIDETLNELRLEAHPEKSGILVFGRNREKLKEKIRARPTVVQGFEMQFKESEVYLGMTFDQKGASESITKTIEARKFKCYTKAGELAKKIEDDRLQALGWLAVTKQLYNSIIVPTLTYGCAAFIGMTKQHLASLESIQKNCLTMMLGISTKANYRGLCYVLGILPVVEIIRKLQVSFVNDLIHIKGSGMCKEVLFKDEEAGGIKGLLGKVREHCQYFQIPDVTVEFVHPITIKKAVIKKVMNVLWLENINNPAMPWLKRKVDLSSPSYEQESKLLAKLALCYEIGSLNLKKSRKHEYLKSQGSLDCLVPGCCQQDSLQHIIDCYGYSEKPVKGGNYEDWYQFLVRIEGERVKKFGAKYSLINFKKV